MDKSQRWLPWKAPPFSDQRLQYVISLGLVAIAAGYVVVGIRGLVNPPSTAACSQSPAAGAANGAQVAPACGPIPAAATAEPAWGSSDSAEALANTAGESPATAANKANQVAADNETPRSAARQAVFEELRPGYTLAELCAAGTLHRGLHCETRSANDQFIAGAAYLPAATAASQAISGQVLTSDGLGLAGVRLVAAPERLKQADGLPQAGQLRFWTVTDALGDYALEGLPEGEYTIRSAAHGNYPAARITARTGVDYADLVIGPDATRFIEGLVTSSGGEPLEGVVVLPDVLGQPSVLTGYDGRYRLPVSVQPDVSAVALRFQRPGYVERISKVQLAKLDTETDAQLDIKLDSVDVWTALSGTVYADSGEPLAGRRVELRLTATRQAHTTTTDPRGRYRFEMLEAPAEYRLIVIGGAGYKDYQRLLKLTADSDELDVVVESFDYGKISGQLVNQNGVPVPDFDLVLRNSGSRSAHNLVSTDAAGNFDIAAAPAGELVVASQSAPAILVQGLSLEPGGRLHIPLVLDWGEHEIRGTVVDASDNPVPASRVVLNWSHKADGITTRATRRTAADSQGHFVFTNLGPGPHSLQVVAPGHMPVAIDHDLGRQGYDLKVRLN